jgi:hypothetical protein
MSSFANGAPELSRAAIVSRTCLAASIVSLAPPPPTNASGRFGGEVPPSPPPHAATLASACSRSAQQIRDRPRDVGDERAKLMGDAKVKSA